MTRFRIAADSLSDATLGVIAFAVTVALIALVVSGAVRGVFTGGGSRTVRAQFTDTRQLAKGNPVRIDGVNVGTVGKLSLDPGGRTSTVTLDLDDSAGPLYRDARASIRFRTVLGGAFFVDLERGSPQRGDLGGQTLSARQTDSQVELDDVTSVLRGRARQGLQTMPDELAKALRDPRNPAAALKAVAAASPSLARGLNAVRGQQPDDLAVLLAQTALTTRALDAPGGRLQQLVSGAAAVLRTTAARSADLRSTIDRAPGLMQRTDATLTGLDGTLKRADPLLVKLLRATGQVAPAVAQLRGTVTPADRLLTRARPLLRDLRPAVRDLAAASRQGLPLLDALAPSLRRLDRSILPYMAQPDPGTAHSMAEMIGPAAAALSAIGAYVDNAGRVVRFPATSGNNAFYLPCQTYVNDPDQRKLVACRSLQGAARGLLGLTAGKAKR